jgi:uncharacterized protein (TIGR02679 family)
MNKKLQVFRVEPGFLKLFTLFKEKYRSLGRVGGTVSVKTFTEAELESIAGFLGQSKERLLEKGSIALLNFENELAHTGFADYTLLPLLEAVLQETIFTKKEESEREKQQEDQFIDSLVKEISDGRWWLEWIKAKSSDTRWIWSYYKQNKEEVYEKMLTVFRAFTDRPQKGDFERLPFFSQRTTGNPHFFDPNEVGGKLLLHCMYVDQIKQGNSGAVMPKTVEELNDLLAEYGIMRDDLWNFVTCQGLLAATKNKVHPVWQAAINTHSVMNMPIKELTKVDRVWPALGTNVWIVENSSVCSTIMDAVPNAPVVCTHGQLRVASWQLLDRLVQSNCTLYYSGDMDPEGIVIAEKLKIRYQDRVILWRMDQESYNNSVSNEDISSRLSKLDSLSSPEWNGLIAMMREVKMAGYQEAIVSSLIRDIKRSLD